MLDQIHPNKIRQILFIGVILFLGIVIAKELFFMLGAFLGAITLYVLLRNIMIKLVIDYKWKRWVAASVLIVGMLIVLVLPMWWLGTVLFKQISPFIQNPKVIYDTLVQIQSYLQSKVSIDLSSIPLDAIYTKLISLVQSTLGSTFSTLGNVFMMFFILYFMLTQVNAVELWLRKSVPLTHSNVNELIKESRSSITSNAIGIPLVAIAQGLVCMLGYFIFGVENFFLLGVISAIGSVIPVVGTAIVYIPIALYMMSQGLTWQGVAILIWGTVVVGSSDNIIRFWLQKRMSDTHPLITIFGVIVGLPLFGFLGVIFGPLLLSLFILLIKVYIDEFGKVNLD